MDARQPSPSYAWFIVSLCLLAYILSFVDRQIIALLVEPIRADLELSDTQFSLLTGFAFAIFYALMGLPIARWADVGPRPFIISAGIIVWSIATAVCGLARNFWQLFFARMAVGVGEAALSPTAYSMITDSFPKSKLGLALGIYSSGVFLGSGLAFLVGGAVIEIVGQFGTLTLPIIGELKPWQSAFFIVGLPGVLVGILFILTVRDPERRGVTGRAGYSIGQVRRYIKSHKRTFIAHYLGFGLLSLSLFALLFWAPAYLIRVFGLSARDAGFYLGFVVLIGNSAGTLSSGWLTDVFTRRGHDDAPLRAGLGGGLGVIVPGALFSSMPSLASALAMLALAFYFASFPVATSAAGLQLMAPNRMRAQVTALFFLALNLFGITGGATLVALLTDFVFRNEQLVGYSMSIMCALSAIGAAALLAWGLKHFAVTARSVSEPED
ncbi:MAG: spinster family MFS transporter [Woeseiaceae bacterium]